MVITLSHIYTLELKGGVVVMDGKIGIEFIIQVIIQKLMNGQQQELLHLLVVMLQVVLVLMVLRT